MGNPPGVANLEPADLLLHLTQTFDNPEHSSAVKTVLELSSQLPEEQRDIVLQQLHLFAQHGQTIKELVALQQHLELEILPVPNGTTAPVPQPVDPQSPPKPALPVDRDSSRLDQEKEDLLLAIFSITDTFTKDETRALAQKTGITEEQVRNYFGKLRNNVRSFLQRAQKKAAAASGAGATIAQPGFTQLQSGSTVTQNGTVADEETPPQHAPGQKLLEDAAAQRKQQLERTTRLLDENGAIAQPHVAGQLLLLMQQAVSYEVRSVQLQAVLATQQFQTLHSLCTSKMLELMDTWLRQADADRQVTFMALILRALEHLPISLPLLQASPLHKTVGRLTKTRSERIAHAAGVLLQRWMHSHTPGASAYTAAMLAAVLRPTEVAAALAGTTAAPAPTKDGKPGAPPQVVQRAQSFGAPGAKRKAPAVAARPLTADEIVRAQKLQKLRMGADASAATRTGGLAKAASSGNPSQPAASAAPAAAPGRLQPAAAGRPSPVPSSTAAAKPAAADDDDELTPEVMEALRVHREQKRLAQQQQAAALQQQAALLPWPQGFQPQHQEQAAAMQHYVNAVQQWSQWRRKRLQEEAAACRQAQRQVGSMMPWLRSWGPVLSMPAGGPANPSPGAESSERVFQASRDARCPAVRYPSVTNIPDSPAEPVHADLDTSQSVHTVPFFPSDPSEQAQQNRQMWEAGVRLPGFVQPTPEALAPAPVPVMPVNYYQQPHPAPVNAQQGPVAAASVVQARAVPQPHYAPSRVQQPAVPQQWQQQHPQQQAMHAQAAQLHAQILAAQEQQLLAAQEQQLLAARQQQQQQQEAQQQAQRLAQQQQQWQGQAGAQQQQFVLHHTLPTQLMHQAPAQQLAYLLQNQHQMPDQLQQQQLMFLLQQQQQQARGQQQQQQPGQQVFYQAADGQLQQQQQHYGHTQYGIGNAYHGSY